MKLDNIEGIIPMRDMVVVDILPKDGGEGVYLGGDNKPKVSNVEVYYGVVEAIGPEVDNDDHCPGLELGETAIFSEFAGSYIATNDEKLHKIIRGYDIMATTTDLRNDENSLTPTADRVLVKMKHKEVSEEGLYLSADDARDPRLQDIEYGEVLKLGPTCSNFTVGDLIAFDSFVGEVLRHRTSDDNPELRIVRCPDVLFVKQ